MEFLYYVLAGAAAGLLSGLFGVGGGVIIVSILSFIFTGLGFPADNIMHLALGTSMATIVLTSVSSALAHHRKANVDWRIFRQMALMVVVGTLLGSLVAAELRSLWLQVIFAVFLLGVSAQLLWSASHASVAAPSGSQHSGALANAVAGTLIGICSSLVGIGGGTLTVPYLNRAGTDIRRAIGTSAALGLPIAVAGSVGYIYTGLHETSVLPPWSLGFVYLPAFCGIALASVVTAPLGARLAQRLPTATLKRLFALLLLLVGLRMAWGIF